MATQLQRASDAAPSFDESFRQSFAELLSWRRDVRRFLTDPVEPALLDGVLDLACLAPSVGNSQPWRFVSVESPERRSEIRANVEDYNARALGGYNGEKAVTSHPRMSRTEWETAFWRAWAKMSGWPFVCPGDKVLAALKKNQVVCTTSPFVGVSAALAGLMPRGITRRLGLELARRTFARDKTED